MPNNNNNTTNNNTAPLIIMGFLVLVAVSVSIALLSQRSSPDSPAGFVLPEGNAIRGQQAFVQLGCVECHTVHRVHFDAPPPAAIEALVPLGGVVQKYKTYGQLVTAIIHPSESIRKNGAKYLDTSGQSRMPDYARIMTVEQLTNLVRFLLDHYQTPTPKYPSYQIYPYSGL